MRTCEPSPCTALGEGQSTCSRQLINPPPAQPEDYRRSAGAEPHLAVIWWTYALTLTGCFLATLGDLDPMVRSVLLNRDAIERWNPRSGVPLFDSTGGRSLGDPRRRDAYDLGCRCHADPTRLLSRVGASITLADPQASAAHGAGQASVSHQIRDVGNRHAEHVGGRCRREPALGLRWLPGGLSGALSLHSPLAPRILTSAPPPPELLNRCSLKAARTPPPAPDPTLTLVPVDRSDRAPDERGRFVPGEPFRGVHTTKGNPCHGQSRTTPNRSRRDEMGRRVK